MSVDPGESTGWALWRRSELIEVGTEELDPFVACLGAVFLGGHSRHEVDPELAKAMLGVTLLVVEDWALYPWKLKELAWDKCRTARGIGALSYICDVSNIDLVIQPASIKDAAKAAGAESLFRRPLHENRHLNDAIMHGVHYTLPGGKGAS